MNSNPDLLNERELEILECLVDGLSNREIAAKLFLTYQTVKWYNSQIYSKLQVNNRKEAIIRAQTLGILDAPDDDPLHRLQHNLPSDTLPFIGRERELSELIQDLSQDNIRQITILGSGGMGKTRLSIEAGRRLLAHFVQGVYFIALAPVTSAEQVITTIGEVISFKFPGEDAIKQQLLSYLSTQNMLLIIDNFEHLLESASLLTDILKVAPDVKLLVTSREKLGLSGEVLYQLSGLSIPFEQADDSGMDDSVQLFMEVANRSTDRISEDDSELVANICQMLGGMPLAILLATAWLDTLPLKDIKSELQEGIGLLESDLRDIPERHRSIEAVFDYSWKRLSSREQEIFMRLSVFRGGFTREAAKSVAGAGIRDLQHLVHSSFIQLEASGRYTIHELMRQYGEEKLANSDDSEPVYQAFAQLFTDSVTPLSQSIWFLAPVEWMEDFSADFENIRYAWFYLLEHQNFDSLNTVLSALWYFCDQFDRVQEGIDLIEPLLDRFDDNTSDEIRYLRGHALTILGWFRSDTGSHQLATTLVNQALDILTPSGNSSALTQATMLRAFMYGFENNIEQNVAFLEKALEISLALDEHRWRPTIYFFLGEGYARLKQFDIGEKWTQKARKYDTRIGRNLEHLRHQGDYEGLEAEWINLIELGSHQRFALIAGYGNLVDNAVLAEDHDKAWTYLRRSLLYADDRNYAWVTLTMLGYFLSLFIAEQELELATQVLSLIMNHENTIESTRKSISKYRVFLEDTLAPETFEAAWEAGKQLKIADVITDLMER